MRKKNNMLIFAIVVVFGVFSFTLNTGFAESLQADKGNIDKFKFSSPAAEENFIQYGQLDSDFSLETTVKAVLGSPGDSDFAPSPQRSTSCSTSCSTRCSTNCTRSCTTYCTTNCTRSCSTYCRHYHSPVCE